ncbi:MAG: transcriptional repressor LexA [Acidobacteriaceae bacterium]
MDFDAKMLHCGHYATGETPYKFLASSPFIRYTASTMAITKRQKEVLDFIRNFVERCGYSPSFEEIASGLDLSSLATVHKHISNLERKGLLSRAHNHSRSIDVLPERKASARLEIPLMGRIAAGRPLEAMEYRDSLSLNDIVDNKSVFALEVSGESMRDDHIMHGDYVLVEKAQTARQGEIVVALVDGSETTLKHYFLEGNVVRLQPANSEMEPIVVPAARVAIQGRVLAIIRKFS